MARKTFVIVKDPNSVYPYRMDWSSLLEEDDTLATSTWDVPTPLTQPTAATKTDTTTVVWIAGGVDEAEYEVTNHVVTVRGLEEDAVLVFRMKQKF